MRQKSPCVENIWPFTSISELHSSNTEACKSPYNRSALKLDEWCSCTAMDISALLQRPRPKLLQNGKNDGISESATLDMGICKTEYITIIIALPYPTLPVRWPSTWPNAYSDWSNSWLPGEKNTRGLTRGLCCRCLWALWVLYVWKQRILSCATLVSFTMCNGILALWLALGNWAGRTMPEGTDY